MTKAEGARCDRPSVQDYLADDVRPAPEIYRRESSEYLGSEDLDRTRYLSKSFHDMEVERLWKRVWQMACREEDIPEVGDFVVYDIADASLLVVRTSADVISAYHNSCLHRGAQLKDSDGSMREIRCPFHGFTWDLQGGLVNVPCQWDFPHVDASKFCLPGAKVGTWGGFVFVNLDPGAPPLESFLGDLPAHFTDTAFPFEQRFKAVHVAKVISCNWKVGLEAFLEAYHVVATHPQALMYAGDANTQYDVFPESPNFNRMITLSAVPSPHLGANVSEQEILDEILAGYFQGRGDAPNVEVPEGSTARRIAAEVVRSGLSQMTGVELSSVSDCEVLDSIEYHLFPNLVPWPGVGNPICYRFRPFENDPDRSIFDVMLLLPYPQNGGGRPRGVPVHWLEPDEPWSGAAELGGLGPILDQDSGNFQRVQRGLKASVKPGITLGNYQEARIRQFHLWLDSYLAG